jgi:hypothetical protein
LKNHVYEYDKLIIGNDLSALLYAYINNIPAIYTDPKVYHFFEAFDVETKAGQIAANIETQVLRVPHGTEPAGISKQIVWARLIYLLSLSGLLPLSDKARTIRIEDENTLRVSTEYSRFVKFKFGELLVFHDDNIEGLPTRKQEAKYEVLDWMSVKSGTVHAFDKIETKSDFVRCVYFYPSSRIDGNHDFKDLVAISYLSEAQLQDFNYSDTYARFKIEDLMRTHGIRGKKNGRQSKDPSSSRHLAIKVEATKRELKGFSSLEYLSPFESVKIMNLDAENLISHTSDDKAYMAKLVEQFYGKSR